MKFNIRQSSDVKRHLSSTLVAKRYFKTENARRRELRLARACVRACSGFPAEVSGRIRFTSPRPHSFHRAFQSITLSASPAPPHETRLAEHAEDDQGRGEHETGLRHHLCSRRGRDGRV